MSLQDLQDKYGYVVMGIIATKAFKVGHVFPSYDDAEGRHHCQVVIVGFTDRDEWRQQVLEAGRIWREGENLLENLFVRLRAE